MNRVTLYTKPGCHLCDLVKDIIDAVRRKRAFEVEIKNILDDAGDLERFRNDIPVICVNGYEIARHRLSEVRLEWGLDTYGQSE